MTVHEIITKVIRQGGRFDVLNKELKINVSKGMMTTEIQKFIKANKEDFISYIIEMNDEVSPALSKSNYVTTSAQKRLYFLHEFDKSSLAYNLPQVVRLDGELDRIKLSDALKQLIEYHENLRTSFVLLEGELIQRIASLVDFELEILKMRSTIDETIDCFFRPFDLEQAPLMRVGLLEVSSQEHILIVDTHHIITDGISQSVLIRDFMNMYAGKKMPELRLQYKDYAEWESKRIYQKQGAKEFWMKEFSGDLPRLDLPTDFKRPEIINNEGGAVSFRIGKEQTRQLKKILREERTTMFNFLLSVFNVLISKVTGAEDVVIGTVVAGRQYLALENLVGMFVNTIPLRNYIGGEVVFRDFLETVKSKTLLCLENQAFPFDDLLNEIKIERDASRNPLFDILFAYMNFEEPDLALPGLVLRGYEKKQISSAFDLTLIGNEANEQIYIKLEYAKKIFKKESIIRLTNYFKNIITTVLENLDLRVSEIEVLPEEEKQLLLSGFNQTQVSYPKEKTLIDLFEKQVKMTPENIVLVYNERKMTYSELNCRSNQLARYLIHRGLKEGEIAGIMLERSAEMIISILGILKARAIYLPLDNTQPEPRIHYIIKQSDMRMLLSTNEKTAIYRKKVEVIDVYDDDSYKQRENNLTMKPVASRPAYIIYTSGSTGNPKGVVVKHQSVVNLILAANDSYGMTEEDRVLQFSPYYFDASVLQIWMAFLSGSILVLIDKDTIGDSKKFNDFIIHHKVTHLDTTPSFLESIVFKGENSLKRIVVGGEACKIRLAEKYKNHYAFYNDYGPTETTISSIRCLVTNKELVKDRVLIGRPIANTSAFVLDKNKKLQPIGVSGELYIGGVGLTNGYLKNEALTKERFVKNPYNEKETIYKTGDLARWLPDGNLDYLGRIDNQVKIRGYRIELGEIEYHLASYKGVLESIVAIKDKKGDEYLVGYYISKKEIDVFDLKTYLSLVLPEYMIPSFFKRLKKMPLTSNGKLNRKALPFPDVKKSDGHIPPSNQIEKKLVKIWSELLHIKEENISISMNFFDVGGNSLKLINLTNRVNEEFEVEIPVANMFKFPVIALLSKYLIAGQEEFSKEKEVSLVRDVEQRNRTLALLNKIKTT